jgi:hypothetical protein
MTKKGYQANELLGGDIDDDAARGDAHDAVANFRANEGWWEHDRESPIHASDPRAVDFDESGPRARRKPGGASA